MKFILLLIAVAGVGGWYYYSQSQKIDEKTKTTETASAAPATQSLQDTSVQTPIAQELKKDANAVQEKQKLLAQYTEKMQKALDEKKNIDAESAKLASQKTAIDEALQSGDITKIETFLPDNSPSKVKLQSLKNSFTENKNKLKSLNDEILNLEKDKKKEETGLSVGRESKKAIGWRWTSDPTSTVRPMRDLPENRTQPVRFIYGERERDVKANELASKIDTKKTELEELKKKDASLKADAQKIRQDCINELSALKANLDAQIRKSTERVDQISEEIKSAEAFITTAKG